MHCVILAGGVGTRLKPYTTVIPKPLMPVGKYCILDVILQQLKKYKITKVTLSVGYLAELIKAFCGNGNKYGLEIDYITEESPLGTGGVIAFLDNIDTPYILMNGDLLTSINYLDLYKSHLSSNCDATLAVFERHISTDFGVITTDNSDHLKTYEEKPIIKQLVSTGIYVLNPCIKDYVVPLKPIDMPSLMNKIIKDEKKVNTFLFKGHWLDIGRHEDYELAINQFSENINSFIT